MWYAVDPLFEKYTDISPYVYCAGNPVRFVDPDGREYYSSTDETGNEVVKWQDSEKLFYVDEKGTWEYFSAGQKEDVVVTPTQEQKNDIKEKRAEELNINIKNYWREKANNAKSWDVKFGYWLKSKGCYDIDEKFSKAARPIAQGVALLNPLVGIPNDIKTIFTDEDIYENEANSVDMGFAVADLFSFGFAKYLKIGSTINKLKIFQLKQR